MPPLDDDDDVVEKTSSKPGAKERMAERAAKAAKGEIDATEEDSPVIDVSDRDDDDDDSEPAQDGPKKSVRQEKKRNRYREMSDRAAAAERARQETETRFSQMMNIYERTVAAQQRPATPDKDEYDSRLEGIYREQETLYTELQLKQNRLSQQDKDRIEKRAKELDAEKIAVTVQKHMRQNGGGQPARGPADTMQAMLQIEYPEVVGHEDALGWAQGYYQMARREGRQASIALARESMDKARQRFRLGAASNGHDRRPPPTAAIREKYAGVGRGGAGPGADDDREEVVMSKAFRKMANGKYPHIKDEKKRYEMWARGPGKRLLAGQRAKHSM
jgi:hypothetical protein